MKFLVTFLLLLTLTGCGDDYKDVPKSSVNYKESVSNSNQPRFSINLEQIVEDRLAYGNKRGVYRIVDNKTGKEYFGISGIGITELGTELGSKFQGKFRKEIEQ
jgi:hypothetical protein